MRSHSINSKRLEIRLWSLPVKGFNVNLPAFSELKWFAAGLGLCWLAGCSSTKVASVPKIVVPAPVVVVEEKTIPTLVSLARTPKEYRQDAAKHIYGCNQHRIHQGKLPPLLYAIGALSK